MDIKKIHQMLAIPGISKLKFMFTISAAKKKKFMDLGSSQGEKGTWSFKNVCYTLVTCIKMLTFGENE